MKKIVNVLITDVVGIALFPVLQQFIAGINASGTNKVLLGLVPIFYLIGLVSYSVLAVKGNI